MRWNRALLWILVLICGSLVSKAQDIHFSQFYASPLTLNPALTGLNNCDYRAVINYRDQWSGFLDDGFNTVSVSYDQNILRGKFGSDFIGIGGVIVNDKSGDGGYTVTNLMGSASYHKSLGTTGKHHVGVGIQIAYSQERLDYENLTFPESLTNGVFVEGFGNSKEPFIFLPKDTYLDYQAGAMWYGEINERISGYGGVALFHLSEPSKTFLGNDTSAILPRKFVVHGGAKIVQGTNLTIVPNFLFMRQAKAKELNIGASVEYNIPDNQAPEAYASFGAWLRLNGKDPDFSNSITESIVVAFGLGYQNVGLGVSYDINISNLNAVSNYRGGFEISLIYTGCISFSSIPNEIVIPCPRL